MMLYASTTVLLDELLLDDFVIGEIFIEVFVLLDDTLLEVLLVILLNEDSLTVLLENGLIVEVLLDEGLNLASFVPFQSLVVAAFLYGRVCTNSWNGGCTSLSRV